uniref:glycoside hydrolase family 32 protein n=1 Tax=Candidatus Enterococcus willemsii TaxID=1857215 RepID=UPI00403FAC6C
MSVLQEATNIFTISETKYSYHIHPKNGWGNDPNGLVFFHGRYHVFFQCNPFETNNKRIFWAHVSSEDLVTWRYEPFALAPDQEYDQDGCFSGSAIVSEGKLYLVYTGHKNNLVDYTETQRLAVSEDGIHFNKIETAIIANPPANNTHRFRDPKIWQTTDFYLVVGGESKEHLGQVHLYRSKTILGPWEYQDTIVKAGAKEGTMWECPDFFVIDNQRIGIISPKGLPTDKKHGFDSVYLKEENGQFEYVNTSIDAGLDFYAPQTFWDEQHQRRVLFGWFGLPEEQEKEAGNKQAGALTLPRQVRWINNKLCFPPIKEVEKLRIVAQKQVINQSELRIGNTIELHASGNYQAVMLGLLTNQASYKLTYYDKELTLIISDNRGDRVTTQKIEQLGELRLFLDKELTELYINGGEYVFSNKVAFNTSITLIQEGLEKVTLYPLKTSI